MRFLWNCLCVHLRSFHMLKFTCPTIKRSNKDVLREKNFYGISNFFLQVPAIAAEAGTRCRIRPAFSKKFDFSLIFCHFLIKRGRKTLFNYVCSYLQIRKASRFLWLGIGLTSLVRVLLPASLMRLLQSDSIGLTSLVQVFWPYSFDLIPLVPLAVVFSGSRLLWQSTD